MRPGEAAADGLTGQDSTHGLEMRSGAVVRRFLSCGRGEPQSEWRALTLPAGDAPGRAPQPLEADVEGTRRPR